MSAVVFHGDRASRQIIRDYEFFDAPAAAALEAPPTARGAARPPPGGVDSGEPADARARRRRCGACEACNRREACGECGECNDFGMLASLTQP